MKVKTLISFWKPFLWLVLICLACFLPGQDLPKAPFLFFPYFDKVVHFGMYFVFVMFLVKPISGISRFSYFWPFLITAIISGLIELLQAVVTSGRSASIADFYANLAGALTGTAFYFFYARKKKFSRYL